MAPHGPGGAQACREHRGNVRAQIAKLEADLQAEAKGDAKKAKDAKKSIETYTSWLDQARRSSPDFSA